jgi:hypothetical protein
VSYISLGAVLPAARVVSTDARNPFTDNAENRIRCLTRAKMALPKHGKLNGYLKITFCENGSIEEPGRSSRRRAPFLLQVSASPQSSAMSGATPNADSLVRNALGIASQEHVSRMPKGFGLGCTLREVDHRLFIFCTFGVPVCDTLCDNFTDKPSRPGCLVPREDHPPKIKLLARGHSRHASC